MSEYVQVPDEAVDWLKKHYPALCIKAGLCERIAGRLYTRTTIKPTQQDAPTDAPLSGKWHHGNGILCCGSLRIAAIDIDTQPAEAVQAEILDWMCARLNAPAQDAAGDHPRYQGIEHDRQRHSA